jgi:hypothetical protein
MPYFREAKLFEPNFHRAKLFVPILKWGDLSKLQNQPRNKMSILPRAQHRGYFVRKCETECHYVEIEWTKLMRTYYRTVLLRCIEGSCL